MIQFWPFYTGGKDMGNVDESFSLVSDPRSLYLTNALKDTTKRVDYTIQRRQGLTYILGDLGLGKTSILRMLHWKYEDDKKNYLTTLIPTPHFQSDFAMLKQICGDFGISPRRSLFEQQKAFEAWLLKEYQEGRNVVLFIDEAQKLKNKELELIRVLLNIESYDHKLIQIILVGQLELKDRLSETKNRAIKSRVFAPSILTPLTLEETHKMIEFRCKIMECENPFTNEAIESIYEITNGIPRSIVKLCFYSIEESYGQKITSEIVKTVAEKFKGNFDEEDTTGTNRTHIVQSNPKGKAGKQQKARSAKRSGK